MIERLTGTVEKVTFIKKYENGLDQVELQIDFDTVIAFGDATEFTSFLNQSVMYTKRPDIINGALCQVVYDLVVAKTVQTVQSTENIKLVPEGTKRTVCNFEIKDIRYGEYYPNRIALMSDYELGSSPKAKWYDIQCIDAASKAFSLRLFSSNTNMEDTLNAFKGNYIAFDLESTKYGYQTKEVVSLPNDVELSPEVTVAQSVIEDYVKTDGAMATYCNSYQFINNIKTVIDGEPGYHLVRIASEMYLINAIDNISTDLNIRSMKRAAICSRGYLLPKTAAWSRPLLNSQKILRIEELKNDKELRLILDPLSDEPISQTKIMYTKIRGLVDDIVKVRRGNENKEDIDTINSMRAAFNGLC